MVLKGAAKHMPAYNIWQSDAPLAQLDGNSDIEVEIGKKETRRGWRPATHLCLCLSSLSFPD